MGMLGSRIITQSEAMQRLLARVGTIAGSDGPVLLVGETGVGKELFADYVHRLSRRREGPFVGIALSAMPHELLESELFGHERGAYTSALNEKKGLFELACRGSIFLDDIDDVPPAIQTKLLRVLESHEVMRVGGTQTIPVDVRLIAASKVDLREWVRRSLFRADLYYRINVFPVDIPPLRERREDIPSLVRHFLSRFLSGRELDVTPAAMRALKEYGWPGNVRELRNVVQRVALFAEGRIDVQDLPPEFQERAPLERLARECTRCMIEKGMPLQEVVACLETQLLKQALEQASGNQSAAARILGLNLSTLRDKLHKYGLGRESARTGACSASSASYAGARIGPPGAPAHESRSDSPRPDRPAPIP